MLLGRCGLMPTVTSGKIAPHAAQRGLTHCDLQRRQDCPKFCTALANINRHRRQAQPRMLLGMAVTAGKIIPACCGNAG